MPDERSELAIILNSGEKVTLGGEPYDLRPPTIENESLWHETLAEIVAEASGALKNLDTTDYSAAAASLIQTVLPLAARRGVAWMRDAVFAYDPAIPADVRARVTAAEAIAAFRAILRLEKPFFGECWNLFVDLGGSSLIGKKP